MKLARWAFACALGLCAAAARGQEIYDPYEQIYGTPIDVPLADLAQSLGPYEGRPVRTRGTLTLSMESIGQDRTYLLRDAGFSILLVPRPEVLDAWDFEGTSSLGRRMEVTGLYSSATQTVGVGPSGVLEFWKFGRAPDEDSERRSRARMVTIEALTSRPQGQVGALVRVAGEFRGQNLFGDLPMSSRRWPADWVLRDGFNALWITGRPPRGEGWRLDPALRRDSGKWLEVVGRVEVWKDVVYVRAQSVTLGRRSQEAAPAAAPGAPPAPPEPPQVVFSLPLDGERGIPRETRFALQFNKDMDEQTFAGHLLLRYVGAPGPAALPPLKTSYDAGRRAITIEPGDALRAGLSLELLLLDGIKDIDGMALIPRAGGNYANAVDVLRFEVAN